ncbi:hypothetical protein [Actinomadura hibisca]|uniref:hypothetical protein n=1 Tax=Actinomadura hibisca TaxID=68565 RepID=UPI0012FC27A8|nr:hypothetical protein [Actinomadura hibisca]
MVLIILVLLLWFGISRWLGKPQRDAEEAVKEQASAVLVAAARDGLIDKHAALRAARISASRLVRFEDSGKHARIDVMRPGYGGFHGKSVAEFCYRFSIAKQSVGDVAKVTANKLGRCPRPVESGRDALERIRLATEVTRDRLAEAAADAEFSQQRTRAAVHGELGDLWAFGWTGKKAIITVDYISLTSAGEIEAVKCVQFTVVRETRGGDVVALPLPECPLRQE